MTADILKATRRNTLVLEQGERSVQRANERYNEQLRYNPDFAVDLPHHVPRITVNVHYNWNKKQDTDHEHSACDITQLDGYALNDAEQLTENLFDLTRITSPERGGKKDVVISMPKAQSRNDDSSVLRVIIQSKDVTNKTYFDTVAQIMDNFLKANQTVAAEQQRLAV